MVQPAYGSFKAATIWSGAETSLRLGQSVKTPVAPPPYMGGWSAATVRVEASGAINVVRNVHPLKARSPMVMTESGMVMLANELHLLKAYCPMVVTEYGMAMLANELHP